MSDWGATHDSAADNANAGMDTEQPGDYIVIGGGVYSGLKASVNNGSVTVDRLNKMVARILAGFYRLGQDSVSFSRFHPSLLLHRSLYHFYFQGLSPRQLRRTEERWIRPSKSQCQRPKRRTYSPRQGNSCSFFSAAEEQQDH